MSSFKPGVRMVDRMDMSRCAAGETADFSSPLTDLIAIVASERKPSRSTTIVDTSNTALSKGEYN